MKPTKAEYDDLGPHNGMGEPDPQGSYTAFMVRDEGERDDAPQSLTFMVPTHQIITDAKEVCQCLGGSTHVPVGSSSDHCDLCGLTISDEEIGHD